MILLTRTIYRHIAIRVILYPIVLLAALYTAHFAADLLIPMETTDMELAQAAIYLADNDLPTPHTTFVQDGCTLFPDKLLWHDFRPACLEHDIAYWAGGSKELQRQTNHEFRKNIAETGPLGPAFSWLMYVGVTYFGNNGVSRVINTHWGFGWNL